MPMIVRENPVMRYVMSAFERGMGIGADSAGQQFSLAQRRDEQHQQQIQWDQDRQDRIAHWGAQEQNDTNRLLEQKRENDLRDRANRITNTLTSMHNMRMENIAQGRLDEEINQKQSKLTALHNWVDAQTFDADPKKDAQRKAFEHMWVDGHGDVSPEAAPRVPSWTERHAADLESQKDAEIRAMEEQIGQIPELTTEQRMRALGMLKTTRNPAEVWSYLNRPVPQTHEPTRLPVSETEELGALQLDLEQAKYDYSEASRALRAFPFPDPNNAEYAALKQGEVAAKQRMSEAFTKLRTRKLELGKQHAAPVAAPTSQPVPTTNPVANAIPALPSPSVSTPVAAQSAPVPQPRIVQTATNPTTGEKIGLDASTGQWIRMN